MECFELNIIQNVGFILFGHWQIIDDSRKGNLSSAIRLAVLAHYRAQIPQRAPMVDAKPQPTAQA